MFRSVCFIVFFFPHTEIKNTVWFLSSGLCFSSRLQLSRRLDEVWKTLLRVCGRSPAVVKRWGTTTHRSDAFHQHKKVSWAAPWFSHFLFASRPPPQASCTNRGGNLASFHNKDEFEFIRKFVMTESGSYERTWVGGCDAAKVSLKHI